MNREKRWAVKGLAVAMTALVSTSSGASAETIQGTVRASGVRSPEDVVVFVGPIPRLVFPPPEELQVIRQKALTFIPHVLPVLVGTTVDFRNNKEAEAGIEIRHNVFSPSPARPFNLGTFFRSVCRLGSKDVWFHNYWMSRLRGLVDRILLGVGSSRGRRSLSSSKTNDELGFWRVEDRRPDHRPLLRAEMKLPGRAWLELQIDKEGNRNKLSETLRCV